MTLPAVPGTGGLGKDAAGVVRESGIDGSIEDRATQAENAADAERDPAMGPGVSKMRQVIDEFRSIVAAAEGMASCTHSFAALDTLEYLRRGGRVSLLKFSVGTLLQLKPILKMHAGKIVTDRARTSGGAIRKPIDLAAHLEPLESVALVHASALDRLDQLRREVEARFPGVPIRMVGEVAPVIGAHVGPRSVRIVCVKAPTMGIERS